MLVPIPSEQDDRAIYFPMAVGMLSFTVFAFAQKVVVMPDRLARYDALVIVHALSMIGWLALFTWQSWAAAGGRIAAHRITGMLSVVVVVAALWSGVAVSRSFSAEFGIIHIFLGNVVQLGTFGLLWAAGVICALRGWIGAHRRLMLLAAMATLTPPISRVTQTLGLPNEIAAVIHMGLILTVLPLTDLLCRGRPHPATLGGLAVVFVLLAGTLVAGLTPSLADGVMAWIVAART